MHSGRQNAPQALHFAISFSGVTRRHCIHFFVAPCWALALSLALSFLFLLLLAVRCAILLSLPAPLWRLPRVGMEGTAFFCEALPPLLLPFAVGAGSDERRLARSGRGALAVAAGVAVVVSVAVAVAVSVGVVWRLPERVRVPSDAAASSKTSWAVGTALLERNERVDCSAVGAFGLEARLAIGLDAAETPRVLALGVSLGVRALVSGGRVAGAVAAGAVAAGAVARVARRPALR